MPAKQAKSNRLFDDSIRKKDLIRRKVDIKSDPAPKYSYITQVNRKPLNRTKGKAIKDGVNKLIDATENLKKEKHEEKISAIHPKSDENNKRSPTGVHPRNPTPAPVNTNLSKRTKSQISIETQKLSNVPNKSTASKNEFNFGKDNRRPTSPRRTDKNAIVQNNGVSKFGRPQTSNRLSPRSKKTTENNNRVAKNPSVDQIKPVIDRKHKIHSPPTQIPEKEIAKENKNNEIEIEQTQQESLKEVNNMNELNQKKINELISDMDNRFEAIKEILNEDLFKCIYDEIPKNLLEDDV